MSLEYKMMSEMSKYRMIPLTWGTQGTQVYRGRMKNSSCHKQREEGNREFLFNGYGVSVLENGMSFGDCLHNKVTILTAELYSLKWFKI